ncbi:hypothetical protein D1007_29145 [Hordeum vulgare]|nr:hypothetical protein D1007_29145 [Hordeum vulgare]
MGGTIIGRLRLTAGVGGICVIGIGAIDIGISGRVHLLTTNIVEMVLIEDSSDEEYDLEDEEDIALILLLHKRKKPKHGGMGRTCVYVHHVDKDVFLKGNIDPDPDELDMVFDMCPSYAELLEQVRKDLNWMDPSGVVEFDGRHHVGFGMHIRWKTMRVNSEQRWLAYKDTVAESLDKALELFAIKTNVPNFKLDLNRVASPIVEAIPAPINEESNVEPLSCVEHEQLLEANDEHDDDENDGNVLHDNNLGDWDKYNLQETMDHSIPYLRGYASESDDEGPDEQVDEEGFTPKEAEAFGKVLKRDHRTPLFEDLSLADEVVVDGGEGILFGVRPLSHRDRHVKNIILPRHIELRPKWERAYDEDVRRYGQMTSNMEECFNRVLKGVRALPVTAIVQYTFDKLRAYFLKY